MDEHRILVAEDDDGIREAIGIYLKNQGYGITLAANGQEAWEQINKEEPHLAVVDLMMPVMDGWTLIEKIRSRYNFPIIILSAKAEEIDKINGLTMGADDYLTKPFSSMELIARVRSALRRYDSYLDLKEGGAKEKTPSHVLQVGGIKLNSKTREVWVDDKLMHFTPKEFQILELLMQHPGQVFSATQIYESIWKEDALSTETVTVHIRKLREKIEANPKEPQYLQVVWGVGYKLRGDIDS